jgi:hypothetical protein
MPTVQLSGSYDRKRPLSTQNSPQIFTHLLSFTCGAASSAHDKAPFRNDPVACCKLRCEASAPASQPCFQTLFRPSGTRPFPALDPLSLGIRVLLSHRATLWQLLGMPRSGLAFPQSLICGAC